jgi:hypothetical protein
LSPELLRGILADGQTQLIATFLGYTAISAIAIQGYASNKSNNGGGIYDGNNSLALNTNTIVLFGFVLGMAFIFSWLYFLIARMFTKQFIVSRSVQQGNVRGN